MAGSRALIARIVAVFALLFCAVVALRGYIPGLTENPENTDGAPAVLSVILMPVLLTVSIVVLLAGVIASQHRLPLAMADLDIDESEHTWRLGRFGVLMLFALAVTGVLASIVFAVYFIGFQRAGEQAAPAPDQQSEQTPRPAAPPASEEDEPLLTGTGLILATAAAVTLVAVAVTGLVVVTVNTQRREREPDPDETEGVSGEQLRAETLSLVKAAEMGLAAMTAPGQDPRTAIIACYLAVERGLRYARAAAPLASDTPMEVLARAFEHGALHDASARELVALFEEARFSPHAMQEWQRMRAEQLLRVVLSDLQGTPIPEVPDPELLERMAFLSDGPVRR